MNKEITKEVVDKVNELLKQDRVKARKYIESYFGICERNAQKKLNKIINEYIDSDRVSYSGDSNDLQEVLRQTNVDLTKWEVETYTISKKEVKKVDDFDHITYGPKYEFNIKLRKKKIDPQELIKEFIEKSNKHAPKVFKYNKLNNAKRDCLYVINQTDLHLGKMAWNLETLWGNWDSKSAKAAYKESVYDLMAKAPLDRIERILFVVGSDQLHYDSPKVESTAGTRLDGDTRWAKMYNEACAMTVEIIEELASNFSVTVMVSSGNHANVSEYCLGSYISAWFRNNKNVEVNNAPSVRKYYGYGNTLIGFVHNGGSLKDLPLIMFRENQSTISNYKFFEILTGDKHHERTEEIKGIKCRITPALCPPDFWHSQNNFVGNIQTSMAFLYHKEHGIISINYSNPIN